MPFYDRSDLIALTTQIVEDNLLRGMLLVVVDPDLLPLRRARGPDRRHRPFRWRLLFAFICLDLQNASANLLSIGAIDFGILVDGAVVMVENIFRQIAVRKGTPLNVEEIISDAAAEVDRPLFYAVAVIVVGFLPIYVLSGPSGTLFKPMADTMIFALVGSLMVTLTLLPVLCSWFMRKGVRERRNRRFRGDQVRLRRRARCLSRPAMGHDDRLGRRAGGSRCCSSRASARSSCRTWTRARCGCARRCPTRFRSTKSSKIAPKVRDDSALLPRGHDRRLGTRAARRRHRSDRLLQRRVLRRASSPTREWTGTVPRQAGT